MAVDSWRGRVRLEGVSDCLPGLRPQAAGRSAQGAEMQELQEELANIRRSLASLGASSVFRDKSFEQAEIPDDTETDTSGITWLSAKKKLLMDLADNTGDSENVHLGEYTDMMNENNSTIKQVETLMRTIETRLDNFDLNVEGGAIRSRREVEGAEDSRLSLEKMRLKDSIEDCQAEEISWEKRIEMKTRELKELERLAELRTSFQQDNLVLEALKEVSVLGMSSGHISLQLETYLPDTHQLKELKRHFNSRIHELNIRFDTATLSILKAELKPKDINVDEIVSAVEDENGFFEKVAFIVKQVQTQLRDTLRIEKQTHTRRSKR